MKKTPAGKESFSNILGERVTSLVGEMDLRVPVETQQVRKVDLNWTCLFCSHGNGEVRLRTGTISGLLFRTTQILDLFRTSSLDFFILLYECNLSPYRRFVMNQNDQYGIAPMAMSTGPTEMYKICICPIE